ncbi:PGLP2 [Symbiodinium natans]|uniref:PGLP2 protein n=1 Tax=Symbiodinium natans TaxID=878477 RepID=A0A812MAB3_9DINO|nr:PGLP2 [Symbiodinium natans]
MASQPLTGLAVEEDGTLYHAGEALPNVAEAIALLRSLGKSVFFVTNTSSRSREQLRDKLCRLGIDCRAEECVPSGVFAATYIRQSHPEASEIYVIGGGGLVAEFEKLGFRCHGGPTEDEKRFSEDEFKALASEVAATRFDGVVVGWDTGITYYKVAKSALVFQLHPECFFYATNDDPADRVGSWLLPGNGPLLKAVEASCSACAASRRGREQPWGDQAEVLGKPNPAYARLIAEWAIALTQTLRWEGRLGCAHYTC